MDWCKFNKFLGNSQKMIDAHLASSYEIVENGLMHI